MVCEVFISYVKNDFELAKEVESIFEDNEVHCFSRARDNKDNDDKNIEALFSDAKIMIHIYNENDSANVDLNEVNLAIDHNVSIIPFKIVSEDDTEKEIEGLLNCVKLFLNKDSEDENNEEKDDERVIYQIKVYNNNEVGYLTITNKYFYFKSNIKYKTELKLIYDEIMHLEKDFTWILPSINILMEKEKKMVFKFFNKTDRDKVYNYLMDKRT